MMCTMDGATYIIIVTSSIRAFITHNTQIALKVSDSYQLYYYTHATRTLRIMSLAFCSSYTTQQRQAAASTCTRLGVGSLRHSVQALQG